MHLYTGQFYSKGLYRPKMYLWSILEMQLLFVKSEKWVDKTLLHDLVRGMGEYGTGVWANAGRNPWIFNRETRCCLSWNLNKIIQYLVLRASHQASCFRFLCFYILILIKNTFAVTCGSGQNLQTFPSSWKTEFLFRVTVGSRQRNSIVFQLLYHDSSLILSI